MPTLQEMILAKLTARNYLAVVTSTALIIAVIYAMINPTVVSTALKDPLVAYIFGSFNVVVVLVYQFYFRKPQSKESKE